MSGVRVGQVELALEILLGDFEILQGHVRTLMTEQFHDASSRRPPVASPFRRCAAYAACGIDATPTQAR